MVLDTASRRVVGWPIDSRPTAALVTNALGMAIDQRRPPEGETVIHSYLGDTLPDEFEAAYAAFEASQAVIGTQHTEPARNPR